MKHKRARKRKFLEIAVYILLTFAILLELRRLFYAIDMFAYTEAAMVLMGVATLLIFVKVSDEFD